MANSASMIFRDRCSRWSAIALGFALAAILGVWPVTALHSQQDNTPTKPADQDQQIDQPKQKADQLQPQTDQSDEQVDQPKTKSGQAKSKQAKAAKKEREAEAANELPAVLWSDPGDIASRDLVNGAGSAADAPDPKADYTFEKEDMNGTAPKFYVRDTNGVEWLVKLGVESKPETAAARLVWAVGYFTDEDYFVPRIHVNGLEKLHRKMPGASVETGMVPNVRLKRQGKGLKKVENWPWIGNPFDGTREFHGLLVMMALINNWDLKEVNNKVYVADNERHYLVSDLGASFGKTGTPVSHTVIIPVPKATKGVLKDYENSKFIKSVRPDSVSFDMHIGAPFFIKGFEHKLFAEYSRNAKLMNDVPIDDVHWIAQALSQLTPGQIRDAFRAAGYDPEEAEGYAKVVERRIMELNQLPETTRESETRK